MAPRRHRQGGWARDRAQGARRQFAQDSERIRVVNKLPLIVIHAPDSPREQQPGIGFGSSIVPDGCANCHLQPNWGPAMTLRLSHLEIHWGLSGAREKFEEMVSQLIHVERPDAQRIRVVQGDDGVDSYEGALTEVDGIDVYQVKFFPKGVGDDQKKQIRESFATARDSKRFKMKSWTLCLPIDMSADESKWFEQWAEKQRASGIEIKQLWGALKIENLLLQARNRNIREAFFREENPELLRAHAEHLQNILKEIVQRVPMPTKAVLDVTLEDVRPRNSYIWDGDRMVVEVELVFRATNVGEKAIEKWSVQCELAFDDRYKDRLITNKSVRKQ
jgi:hypothetical protein